MQTESDPTSEVIQLTSRFSNQTKSAKTFGVLGSVFSLVALRRSHANTFRGGSINQVNMVRSALIVGYILVVLLISGLARA